MINKKILFVIILLCSFLYAHSRNNVQPTGSKAAAMGNAFVSRTDVFAIYHNQAGLAKMQNFAVALFYENRFFSSLQANNLLQTRAIVASLPVGNGNIALQYNMFGPSRWAESNAGIAYAIPLSEKISAGIQISYFGSRMPEDNSTVITMGFEGGVIYAINDNTSIGAHLSNPYTPAINTSIYNEHIPWKVKFGGHSILSPDFIFSYEIEKIQEQKNILKLGGEWLTTENFALRAGINTTPVRFYAGFGYNTNSLNIDISYSNNFSIGYVLSASVIFNI